MIQGARQVGKSTLANHVLRTRPRARLVTLDDPEVLASARADPVTFVRHDDLLGIDEIQRAPELLLPIKARVDADPRPRQYLLTGSAHVLTLPRVSDALAGRLEIVELRPLSQGEVRRRREGFVDRLFERRAEDVEPEQLDRDEVNTAMVIQGASIPGFNPAQTQTTAWGRTLADASSRSSSAPP